MLRNYLTIVYRNLKRNKGYTFINIGGLAIGLAACLVIGLYLRHELSYDRFHEKADRVYRLVLKRDPFAFSVIPAQAAERIASDFPEVVGMVRFDSSEEVLLRNGQPVKEDAFFYVDPSFFDVFSFRLKKGNPETALAEPNTVVLTVEAARRYFPDKNPLGQTLTLRDGTVLRVTGVLENVPSNSHLQFDLLASFSTLGNPESWSRSMGHQSYTYLLLSGEEAARRLDTKLDAITSSGSEESLKRFGFTIEGMEFGLQPLTDIHLHPFFGGALQPETDVRTLYVFGLIALFVLVIACVNYMNLATARSLSRAREVGMRKVLGAYRTQLAGQFLGEAALMTCAAALLALFLARILLPGFSMLMGLELSFGYFQDARLAALFIGALLVVSLVAGSYPALILSRFEPVEVLKGATRAGTGSARFRKGLVIFQFAVTTALIAGTFVAYHQLRYMRSKPLGYDTERIVTLPLVGALEQHAETFKAEVLRLPGVTRASVATGAPNSYWASSEEYEDEKVEIYKIGVDEDYLETMGMKLVAGRGFSGRRSGDSTRAFIVNETAARLFGLQDEVGEPIEVLSGNNRLIGIVSDFHTASLHEPIRPTVLSTEEYLLGRLVVRLAEGRVSSALDALEKTWKQFAPVYPFTYQFLDDTLAKQYRTEQQQAELASAFAGLAIFIACLGLFGLAAFTAERRTKEIGIRKVLGASVPSIVALLSKDFLKLVLIAFVIAAPVAYFAMQRWLQDFAYRIELGPWIFFGAGALALVIALATVSYQAIRAALANPVDALWDE